MSGFLPGPYGPPLVYRSISEWRQLALSGQLRPEHQLYDPVRGVWLRAGEHPELRPYFPAPQVNWGALLGLGTLAALAIAASGSTATETPRGLDVTSRPERRTGKKRVFVSFDFDNDKVLKDFIIGQARNPDSPFEVIDSSLKEAAPMKAWEDKARVAISRSDLVLVMVGRYTYGAPGVLKEVRMAREEGITIAQMIGYRDGTYTPVPNAGRLYQWDWENLKKLLG
ncbi:MAG: TIR domain-containing protein [Candidatus Rokuibacteriota bacterium]